MAFLGMRGTGDWATNQVPQGWREAILYLYPNGDAPLTAIMSKMKTKVTDQSTINWWKKTLPTQGGAVTNIYTDVALSSAYTSGGTAGDTVYVKVAAATQAHIRVGHTVLLRDSDDHDVDCVGKVTASVANGSSSYVAVKLREADDNSSSHDLSDADRILVIGNANAEGADVPDSIMYDPTQYTNYTQIFRTPYSITGTAEQVRLRTGDQNRENQREALELHSIEMEKAFIWGIPYNGTGDNGKPERMTAGLIYMTKTYADSNNVVDFQTDTDTDYAGKTWLEGGEDWLDERLSYIFKYGSRNKLAFCGTDALRGLNRLAKTYGNIQLTPQSKSYGLAVVEWLCPFGVINLMVHPLMSYETTNVNSMIIFEPKDIVYRPLKNRDTKVLKDRQSPGVDGTTDEFLTECALEYETVEGFGYLNGVGLDNTQ